MRQCNALLARIGKRSLNRRPNTLTHLLPTVPNPALFAGPAKVSRARNKSTAYFLNATFTSNGSPSTPTTLQ
jgi:hypothetical protein